MVKPLFKWTGGKGRLFQKYQDLNFFPEADRFDTFVDLFFGAGSVTLWVAEKYPDKKLIINDKNTELMGLYTQIRDNWGEFSEHYKRVYNVFLDTPIEKRKALYNCYKKRYAWNYKWLSEAEIAANLLVMMKINFNGIWLAYKMYGRRYSTAPGKIDYKESIFGMENVEQFRQVLLRATLYNRSFEDVPIPDNSWVFADPPYRDTRDMYSDTFTDELQSKLAKFIVSTDGLYCESNKETGDGFWGEHFPMENIHFTDHKYTCGYGGSINPVTEVLIKNYGNNIPQPTTLDSFFN